MRALKILAAIVIAVGLTAAAVKAFTVVDVTGSYQGDLVVEGQPPLLTLLELKQDGDKVTGKVGDPKKTEEMIPVNGAVDGNTVTLSGKPPMEGMTVDFKLTLDGTHLKGSATFDMSGQKVNFTADLIKK